MSPADVPVARAVWRPPWLLWILLGLLALIAMAALAPGRLAGQRIVLTPLIVAAAVLLIRWLWQQNPALNMCGAIVTGLFGGAWSQIGIGGLPLDRFLMALVLLQLLLRAPGAAGTPRIQIRNVHLLLALTAVYVLASAAAASTLTTESGFLSMVDMFGFAPFLMFLISPAVFSGARERNMLLATLVGVGAYLGVTAIFESVGPHALVFPRYIARVDMELSGERVNGPFQSSVVEGFANYACAVAAVMAFRQWRASPWRHLAAAVAAVCAFGCFLTLERGVWIAAVLATIGAALLTHTGRRWLVPGAGACAVIIASVLALSSALSHSTSARANDQISVWSRENQTSAGLRMLAARPLFGFGWAGYTTHSLAYFRQPRSYPQDGYMLQERVGTHAPPLPLHDTYLAFAVELGLLGALLWLTCLLWGVGQAIFSRGPVGLTPWKQGLLAIALFYLVIALVDPHEHAFPLLLLWTWAGVAFGSESLAAQARRAAATTRSAMSVPGNVAPRHAVAAIGPVRV